MTSQTPFVPGPATPATPTPAKRSKLPLIVGALLAGVLVLGGAGIGAAWFFTRDDKPATKVATAWDLEQKANQSGAAQPEPALTETPGPLLTKDDLKLTLKTVDKQCFGSAGCSVDVKVQATLLTGFESTETWEVTYQVTGGTDGAVIGNFQLTDGRYDMNEESIDTDRESDKLAVKVTSVERIG